MAHHDDHDDEHAQEKGTVAILTAGGFEDLTLFTPLFRFQEAGYKVEVITPEGQPATGDMGYGVEADTDSENANPGDYQALLVPAGLWSADALRGHTQTLDLVAHYWDTDRPLLAIGHGAQVLATAGILDGVELTSWPTLQTDLTNAGAEWLDEPTVTTQQLVTGRAPEDLGNFLRASMKLLEERHETTGTEGRKETEGKEEGEEEERREAEAPAR